MTEQESSGMKVLRFTISHAHLEELMCKGCIARLHKIIDLGHVRDQYVVTALIRQEQLDRIIEKSADRPRWVKWPES
jgi:hypothetical protein